MPINAIFSSFYKSLFLISILVSIAIFFSILSNVIFIDFLRVNPNRSQLHAASLPFIFLPIVLICNVLATGVVFSFSQLFQAVITNHFIKKNQRHALYSSALAIPFSAVFSWYCYDYLTPTDFNLGINTDSSWTPYQHGMTVSRYFVMLCLQSCVTFFSIFRFKFEIEARHKHAKYFLFAIVCLSCFAGVALEVIKRV